MAGCYRGVVDSTIVLLLVGVTGAVILTGVCLFAADQWLRHRDRASGAGLGDAVRALFAGDPTAEAAWIRKFLVVYALIIWLLFLAFVITVRSG